jgi:cytochrome c oxidase assembly factor CtaG/polyferredoxin
MDPVASAILEPWSIHWDTIFLLVAVAVVYIRGWVHLHTELPHRYGRGKLGVFVSGLAVIGLALESPIDAFGSVLLQAHMIQHLLLIAIAPLLLLLGQPVLPLLRGLPRWIFKDALGPFLGAHELKRAGRAIVHPVFTWIGFSAAIIVWHLPRFYELALNSPAWHQVEHACFFWAAILFWWPVIGVWPGERVWPEWAMVPYLLAAGMVNMGLSAALSFSDHVFYPTYATAPRLWGISALEDQAAAGGIMWVPGSIVMLIPAAILGVRALQKPYAGPARTAPRVLTPVRPGVWDLLRTPVIGPVLQHRRFRQTAQMAMLALAAMVTWDGFRGSQIAPLNLAGVLPWIHWRGFAVIALLMAGNLFCMACPFTLPRDLARRLVTPRYRWPIWLRSKWLAAGLLVTYLWAYEAFAPWDRPRATAWMIVGYFAAVLTVDTLFKGASFCKYVCPIGQFHFVHSLVSPLRIGVREPSICRTCATHDCIRGNAGQRGCELKLFQPKKLGNFDCTFCLDCVQACPESNVGILRADQTKSLVKTDPGSGIGRLSQRWDVAALILILVFGAFINAAGMTERVMMWMHRWHAYLGSMLAVVTLMYAAGLLIIPAALIAVCGWSTRRTAHISWRDAICGFAPTFVPLGFSMWLAHFSNHLFTWSNSLAPALGSNWIPSLELFVLDLGLLVTLYASWRVAGRFSEIPRTVFTVSFPWTVLAGGLYASSIWIVFQPMQMRGMLMR